MQCQVCGRINGHIPNCPEYDYFSKVYCHCSICEEGIQNGEEYIVNDSGDYAHWECVDYAKDLAKFLGYEIKKMEDEK